MGKKLNKPCESCLKSGRISFGVVSIGIQESISFDLRLYNCVVCKTTRAKKINKDKKSRKVE